MLAKGSWSYFLSPFLWKNDWDLAGPNCSAGTPGPGLRMGPTPSTPMCPDPMSGSRPSSPIPFSNQNALAIGNGCGGQETRRN